MKKVLGSIAIILLLAVLVFTSVFVRDTTPDRKAVKNIERFGLGSGELAVEDYYDSDRGYPVLVFGDDEYDYAIKAESGDLLAIRINDATRQRLDRELVESGGERITEEQANKILEDMLNRYFPNADRDNISLERTGKHLEEFVYSTVSPMSNGETKPIFIVLAFNGEVSGISSLGVQDIAPEVLKEIQKNQAEAMKEPEAMEVIPVDGEASAAEESPAPEESPAAEAESAEAPDDENTDEAANAA